MTPPSGSCASCNKAPTSASVDLAERLGLSLSGLNYSLKALMDKGLVKLENFQNSQHKFKCVYVLTPAGIAQMMAMTGRFLKRKMEEYEALKAEIDALTADVFEANQASHFKISTSV
jgi:EPS-associated MarR family transcriptional regulator